MGVNAVADDIQKLLQKASGIFSEGGLESLRKASQDNSLDSLKALRKKVNTLSKFTENFETASKEEQQRLLNALHENDLFEEALNTTAGKRAVLDDIFPDYGIKNPKPPKGPRDLEEPTVSRNSNKNKNKDKWRRYDKNAEQWQKYDEDLAEYNQRINDYYDGVTSESDIKTYESRVKQQIETAQKNGELDFVTGSNKPPVEEPEFGEPINPNSDTYEPNFSMPGPNSSTPNAGAGQVFRPPGTYNGGNTSVATTEAIPMSEAEIKMRRKAQRQAILNRHAEERVKLQNQLSAFDESIRTAKTDMGLLKRTGMFFKELWTGQGESTKWLRGRNTRYDYYDKVGNLADEFFGSAGKGHTYNKWTNNFQSNAYNNLYEQFSSAYIAQGGKAGGIRGGMPSKNTMINDPKLMAKMISGDYFDNAGSKFDGISDWAKEHQLLVAGGIAAAGIGVGGLIASNNDKKNRGY